jgi:hypothetical protein
MAVFWNVWENRLNMKNYKKGSATLIVFIIVLVVIAGLGYYIYTQKNTSQQLVSEDQSTKNTDQTVNWKTYLNTKYGFKFKYPANFEVRNMNLTKISNRESLVELTNSSDTIRVVYTTGSVLDLSTAKYGTDKISFDEKTNQWVRTTPNGNTNLLVTEKISPQFTVSGLPYFGNHTGISAGDIIPLSHTTFILISADNGGSIRDVVDEITSTFELIQ